MRTIINPAENSNLSSSIIRTELSTLETEIANTTSGHDHDGSDSKVVDHVNLSSKGTNTHAQVDTALTRLANTSGTNTGDNAANTSIAATKLDDFATPDANTDLNANTTNHGLLLQATAPAAGLTNVVAIENGETVYKNKALFDATAPTTQAFGDAAAVGSAVTSARRDHKHAMMAAPTSVSGNAGTATKLAATKNINGVAFDGSSDITVGSAIDGWIPTSDSWSYASANTITVPSGAALLYKVGDRIKWTQTTIKYGVIIVVTDTLLTIAVNTDYVVTNAAISAISYSHIQNPIGYPTWFNYTPTWYGSTGSAGTAAQTNSCAKFKVDGSACTINIYSTLTNVGSWTGTLQFALPIATTIENVPLAGTVCNNATNPITAALGLPYTNNASYCRFLSSAGSAEVAFSAVGVNSLIILNGTYSF